MPQASEINRKFKRRNNLTTISLVVVSVLVLFRFSHIMGPRCTITQKIITVKGTVTEYIWTNPHVYVKVDATDESGHVSHWALEAQNPLSETEVGWSKKTFKPGDEVEIDVKPAKNGRPVGSIGYTTRIIINGKQFKP